jgi:hypothetical protein
MSWRRLDRPRAVDAFVQDVWISSVTDVVDDESREIRVFPPGSTTRRLTLDASRYREVEPGLFADRSGDGHATPAAHPAPTP